MSARGFTREARRAQRGKGRRGLWRTRSRKQYTRHDATMPRCHDAMMPRCHDAMMSFRWRPRHGSAWALRGYRAHVAGRSTSSLRLFPADLLPLCALCVSVVNPPSMPREPFPGVDDGNGKGPCHEQGPHAVRRISRSVTLTDPSSSRSVGQSLAEQ